MRFLKGIFGRAKPDVPARIAVAAPVPSMAEVERRYLIRSRAETLMARSGNTNNSIALEIDAERREESCLEGELDRLNNDEKAELKKWLPFDQQIAEIGSRYRARRNVLWQRRAASKQARDSRLEKLRGEQSGQLLERFYAPFEERYRRINMEFLRLRKINSLGEEVPAFAAILMVTGDCMLSATAHRETWVHTFPLSRGGSSYLTHHVRAGSMFLEHYYGWFVNGLRDRAQAQLGSGLKWFLGHEETVELFLTCKLEGHIPQQARENIIKAEKDFISIAIVAEAPDWQVGRRSSINSGRLLVVGHKCDQWWLIDSFRMPRPSKRASAAATV